MSKRFVCGAEVIWGNDFSFEDFGMDGDGVVSCWSCSECGAEYEVYQRIEEKTTVDMEE